jgi:predicted dehydrogenase
MIRAVEGKRTPERATRVGIVGLSATRGWALNAHLPALSSLPAFTVTALSASTPQSAQASAEQLGIPHACADAQALVTHPDVDLVLVAVKLPYHAEIVRAASAAGKNVLCEWPLGNGLEETAALASETTAAGVRGFVGLQARSAPPIRFLHDLIAEGEIGEIRSSTLVGCGDRWGPTIPAEVSYLADAANGATMLTIPVGHSLDAFCHCLGELTEVTATIATRRTTVKIDGTDRTIAMSAPDEIAITGQLESGAVVAIHYSGGRAPQPGVMWRINGTRGTIELRGPTGHLQYGQLEIHRSLGTDGDAFSQVAVPAEYELAAVESTSLGYTVANAYALLARDLEAHTAAIPTFDDAVTRSRMLAAIEHAASTGVRQKVAPHDR